VLVAPPEHLPLQIAELVERKQGILTEDEHDRAIDALKRNDDL
jgi:hypothetical protein